MTRTVYVIQHPEATHHRDHLVGGWFDSALTSVGERDAGAIADALREKIPASDGPALWSSDLQRTRTTAEIIGQRLSVEPHYDARLREKSYGTAEGRPQAWLDARFMPPPAVGDRMNHHEGIEGAETTVALADRVYAVMDALLAGPDEDVVVVTHGGALTFIVAHWIRMPISSLGYVHFRGAPGSITVLREDDRWHDRSLAVLADTTHRHGSHTTTEH